MPESLPESEIALDLASAAPVTGDLIQPFSLETSALRGRSVRLGPALDQILSAHAYPEPLARLLAEGVTLACLLASGLKFDGVFTLQLSASGPVGLMVTDITHEGAVRGYVQLKEGQALPPAPASGRAHRLETLVGEGYLAFTVDQGSHTDRYQGIVSLQGASLTDTVRHYFKQSEQVETGLIVAVDQVGGRWRAGGLMLQQLPDDVAGKEREDRQEDWRRAMVLLQTGSAAELLDPDLPQNDMLFRLFHEEGVRVYEPRPLLHKCRCGPERIERVLVSLGRAELDDLKEDGAVVVTCEFCSRQYRYTDADLDRLKDPDAGG